VLPPAEILFEGYDSRPRIVGYRAKWEEDSYEYGHTPRRFDFVPPQLPRRRPGSRPQNGFNGQGPRPIQRVHFLAGCPHPARRQEV